MRCRRSGSFLLVGALALAACGGGGGDASTGAADRARVTVIDEDGDHREAGSPDRTPVIEVASAGAGDLVQTYDTGFVELGWLDGSLTRVGPQTEYELLAIAGTAEAPDVQARLDVGRTWHRVQELGQGGSYQVETAVGTAAVRGTSFAVVCEVVDRCTFTGVVGTFDVLVDGQVLVSVGPGLRVVIGPDGIEQQDQLDATGLRDDPWIDDNLDRDGDEPGPFGGDPGDVGGVGGRTPANDAELVAAVAFEPPWAEKDPRNDAASGWVQDVWNFPTDGGFEPPTPEQEAQLAQDGFVGQRNRQFEILGADPESGTDDAFASIRAADFTTPAQAVAAAQKADVSAAGRPDGASAFDPGVEGVLGTTWTYAISKCTPSGFEVTCEEQPPWTVYRLSMSIDRFVVVVEVQWPDGSDNGPSEAVEVAELLREVFGA